MSAQCPDCSKDLDAADGDSAQAQPPWAPDEQLVPAILAGGRKRMADLALPDRAWVVAGLTLAGLTAEDIAERLRCSLRLVRSIKSLPLTRVCVYAQVETGNWINESRLASAALRASELECARLSAELSRTRDKLNRMLDAHVVGTPVCGRCGTPWDRGNTYFEGTKRRCRNCNRLRQQAYRQRRRARAAELDAEQTPTGRDTCGGYESADVLVSTEGDGLRSRPEAAGSGAVTRAVRDDARPDQ